MLIIARLSTEGTGPGLLALKGGLLAAVFHEANLVEVCAVPWSV